MASLNIDPRSFHIFEMDKRKFLFDRESATTSEISDETWALLSCLEAGISAEQAIEAYADNYATSSDEIASALNELIDKGFFRYHPVDASEQDILIQALLNHIPRRIQLLLAQSCNLGCRYCYAWRNGSNQRRTLMTFDVAKRSIDYLIERSAHRENLSVTFFGGEPLLNWETLKNVVLYCKQIASAHRKTFSFDVTTNASLLTEEKVEFLADHNFAIMVSIDGWEEMHNFNRPSFDSEVTFKTILENATHANTYYKSRGLRPIKVRANLTHEFHDAEKTFAFLRAQGFERIAIAPIEPLPHADQSPHSMTDEDCDANADANFGQALAHLEILKSGGTLNKDDQDFVLGTIGERLPIRLKGIGCGIARNTQCIDIDGNIYPCHRYEGMKAYIIGNVFTGIDRTAVHNYYRRISGKTMARCNDCWIRDYCAGGCTWLLSAKDGSIVDPTEQECNRRRKEFERHLFLRTEFFALKTPFLSNVSRHTWSFSEEGKGAVNENAVGSCTGCSSCAE